MARRGKRRGQDAFGRRAKQEGYPARSIYKLAELDRRLSLLRPGQRVLDLGASPGSWLKYIAERVGPGGLAVGVDVQACEVQLPGHAQFLQLDALALSLEELPVAHFDVVVSDMAPRTSGQRHRDQYLSYELYSRALSLAEDVLVPGGDYVGKIFQGPELDAAREATRRAFAEVRLMRPEATRKESYELFLVGRGRLAQSGQSL